MIPEGMTAEQRIDQLERALHASVDLNEAACRVMGMEDDMTRKETVSSTSDDRVVNNVMRHNYRVLTETEKTQMQRLKDLGLEFVQHLHLVGNTDPAGERQGSRELSLAQTKIEEAVMWGVKHITR